MMRRSAAVLAAVAVLCLSCETRGNQIPITYERLTDLATFPPKFTLTCNISPCNRDQLETIFWSKVVNGHHTTIVENSTFSITKKLITPNLGFQKCRSVLTVNGNEIGTYLCGSFTVTSTGLPSLPSFISNSTNVSGTLPPIGVNAIQSGPHSITVAWSAPPVLGFWTTPDCYAVHYQCTRCSGDSDDGWTVELEKSTTHTITGLQNTMSCDIRLSSLSVSWLPSNLTDTVTVTLTGCTVISSVDTISSTSANISLRVQPPQFVADSYNISLTGTEEPMCSLSSHTLPVVTTHNSTHTLTGLWPYTTYTITATGFNSSEEFCPATATFTTHSEAPSGSPGNLSAVATGSTSISLQWSGVLCEVLNGELLGYTVQYTSTTGRSAMTSSHFVASERFELTGLRPHTNYSLSVAVTTQSSTSTRTNYTGPYSPAVTEQTHEDVPGPVGGLSVSPLFTSLFVSWSEPTVPNGDITGYHVNYQREGGGGERRILNTSSTSSRVTHLQPGTEYTVSVQASTSVGKGSETEFIATSTLPAPRIMGIMIEPVNSSAMNISWDDGEIQEMVKVENARILRYSIRYHIINSTTTEQSNTSGSDPSRVIANLESGKVYYFQVSAIVDVEGMTYVFHGNITTTAPVDSPSIAAIVGGVVMAMVTVVAMAILALAVLVLMVKKQQQKNHKNTEAVYEDPDKIPERTPPTDAVYEEPDNVLPRTLPTDVVYEELHERNLLTYASVTGRASIIVEDNEAYSSHKTGIAVKENEAYGTHTVPAQKTSEM